VTTEYRYRRFRDGDVASINRLYEQITGRRRTVSQFEWQWQQAPGGAAEIWLIEALGAAGRPKLIGHHGIMPIRFTNGNDNLLIGKTENTMVLPEYRSRILYPRFEKRFAAEYENRFDALFSTTGPPEAIRQRRALGYEFSATWLTVQMPTSWGGAVRLLYDLVRRRVTGLRNAESERVELLNDQLGSAQTGSPMALRALDDEEARRDPFFQSFWDRWRSGYGVTPRREREDLDWRFWSNPYSRYVTLVSDSDSDGQGYVIIRRSKSIPNAVSIEDLVTSNPGLVNFSHLLDSALSWMRGNGIAWADFSMTRDSGKASGLIETIEDRDIKNNSLLSRFRKQSVAVMPRKLTANGDAAGLTTRDWYVTPILFEGRSD
jgi:hypothetical protein